MLELHTHVRIKREAVTGEIIDTIERNSQIMYVIESDTPSVNQNEGNYMPGRWPLYVYPENDIEVID